MMITMEDAAARIGRVVIYVSPGGDGVEQGVVTGVNDSWVFVRYRDDLTSKATRPEDLEWVAP